MPDSTDAAFLDDTLHVPLGVVRTHERTRQTPRVPVDCPVTFTVSALGISVLGAFASARNISQGGICFESGIKLAENAEVTVSCCPESGLTVEARGRVIACADTGAGDFRYRVEFVGISAELVAAIGAYVYETWNRNITETVNEAIGERWYDLTTID
jgi:hypothetical protein